MALIELHNVSKHYGATIALDQVNFQLLKGEVHALIGENGAGKSTLMNILAGAVRPDSGAITLAEQRYSPTSPLAARHHDIAQIHQELSLCLHLTVAENIILGIESARAGWLDRQAAGRRTLDVLQCFPRRAIKRERRASQLSV